MKFRIPIISLLLTLLFPLLSLAQTSTLTGVLQDTDTKAPIPGAIITLKGTSYTGTSNDKGIFEIKNVPYGNYTLVVNTADNESLSNPEIKVSGKKTDLGVLKVSKPATTTVNETDEDGIPTISLSETAEKESSSTNSNTTRDTYESAVVFNFGVARFRARGYRSGEVTSYMNGVALENLSTGQLVYSPGGLGSVMYSRDRAYGLNSSSYSFGGLDGSASINTRASNQRKQFQFSYTTSNRTFTNSFAATYGTGLMKGGWAFSSSVIRSWADKGYSPGTFSDSWSWYMSLDKHFGTDHILSLTQLGGNSTLGRQGAATIETFQLTGDHYYNPYWGYQNGKIRNADVSHSQLPLTVLSHEWIITPKSNLKSSAGYQYGNYTSSHIDYYNAPTPTPDYYRNLPSYQDNPTMAALIAQQWKNDVNTRQINWDKMYNMNVLSNPETVTNVDGVAGNNVTGQRSHYVVYDDVYESKRISFNTVYASKINEKNTITAGYSYQREKTEYYKRLTDLLGGQFYVDQNQYAEQAYPDSLEAIQNDLNHPNRTLQVGDKYGYDYISTIVVHKAWLQNQFTINDRLQGYLAVQVVNTNFFRTGLTKSGIFPTTSYGDSQKKNFLNAGVKGGIIYKLDSKSHLYANAAYETKAPTFRNSFVSAKTRNDVVDGLRSEANYSFEGGYMLRTPDVKLRATAYFTQTNHETNVYSFYHDDFHTQVNYNLTNIDTRFIGLELGTEVTLGGGLSANGALALSQNYYTSRYNATITQDNNATVLASNETVYSKNFYVSNAGPQTAASLGLRYRSKNFWTLNLTGNYFANAYSGFNPARRTIAGVDQLVDGSPQWNDVINQQKLASEFTVDFYGSYSWRLNNQFSSLKKRTYLIVNVGVKNLTDNQNLITQSYEQSRFDFAEKNVNKFAPKYKYGYGVNYFIRVILRLN